MAFIDFPPLLQERIVCSISAAAKYDIPANIMLAIAEKEAGKPGQWVRNANGTHDVGYMQFNTAYLNDLARFSITANDVAAAGCYSFDLAAWRLRQHIKHDKGDLWTRIANYHSRTYAHNTVYRADLMVRACKWANWLSARFVTYDVTKADVPASTPEAPLAVIPAMSLTVMRAQQPTIATSLNNSRYVPRKIVISIRP